MNETIGIPIEESLEILFENNITVDWLEWIETSIDVGWQYRKSFSKLEEAFSNLGRIEEYREIEKRIKYLIIKMRMLAD